ncbi:MAG: RNA-binding protein [Patescibacteria group bacterium]
MAKKLFVGSLPYSINDEQLKAHFEKFGEITSASVVMDKFDKTRSRGFGFVEMPNDEEAQKAIDELNGKELDGRAITVSEARPREDRPNRDFGGNRR